MELINANSNFNTSLDNVFVDTCNHPIQEIMEVSLLGRSEYQFCVPSAPALSKQIVVFPFFSFLK